MALDPSIILAQRPVNFMGSLAAGIQTRALQNDAQHQDAFRSALTQYGAGAMNGDTTSMNYLAQFDPAMVQGMNATRQDMAFSAERMQMARDEARREAEAAVANMSAAEAQAAAEQHRQLLEGFATITDPVQWQSAAQRAGIDVPFEQRDFFLAQGLGAQEVLDIRASQAPDAGEGRYRAVGGNIWDYGDGTQAPTLIPGQGQEEVIYGPDGQPIVSRGPAGTAARAIPEQQSKIQLFGTMMDIAGPVINQIEQTYDPSNFPDAAAGALGWGGNYWRSEDSQRYTAAASAWAEGALRLATGAAATPSEIQRITGTYFAVPGDSPETVAFKRQLRGAYEQAVIAASGGQFQPGQASLPPDPNAAIPDPAAFAEQAGATPEAASRPATQDFSQMAPADLMRVDVNTLDTAEQIDAYMAAVAAAGSQ